MLIQRDSMLQRNMLLKTSLELRCLMNMVMIIKLIIINNISVLKMYLRDFPGGIVVKNLPANSGNTGSIPGAGRSHMLQSN